ncbi:MAG: DsbA family protein [Candidatus Pacebacteria bacterium]|jgi:protein-disulfide isomerase|nr:DsbA family protein [Candidatus Paceibacterota bacterium]
MPEDTVTTPTPTRAAAATSTIGIPVAIVIGFALIAGAIYFSGGKTAAPAAVATPESEEAAITVSPVTDADFIRGNPNAPITIVEYSDYDCPFCKNFHDTMKLIMEDYGVTGKVSWVYRQFPLAQLHPNAPRISEAAYCVGELGGDEAFWTFSDLVFSEREVNEPTNMTRLPEFAETAGVARAAFNECLNSGKHAATVEASLGDGVRAGAQGTPYSIILVGDQKAVINGAQPYPVVKQIIDRLITQLEGGTVAPATGS